MRIKNIAIMISAFPMMLACGGEEPAPEEPQEPPLERAYSTCLQQTEDAIAGIETSTTAEDFLRLEDGGTTLIVSTPSGGDIASGFALAAAACVLDETGAPATIREKMGTASALSGPAEDAYDGITVEWSYAAGVGNAGFNAYFRTE